MYKQLVLNLFHSKWIWYIGIATIIINVITALLPSDTQPIILQFSNSLNMIAIIFTTSSYLSIHDLLRKNNNHYFYYALPNTKKGILKGEYVYYIMMLILTSLIIASYLATNKEMYYVYGFMMIIGVCLTVMSLYYLGFAKYWMRYVFTGYFLYGIPVVTTFLFHFLPLRNVNEMDRALPGFDFYLYHLPIYTLIIGVIMFILTYFINLRNITKYDMI
ncbi:hypothetical protein ACFOLA_01090 [Salinicoccus hispanicus]|uniref:ABC-2 transporter permease n=1 Tax=Salinicoccus hispanicus TaxID=157225 RepID=A0A6N8TWV1_9STAP|nr:hypothetical protein [Salinicoccus hispanicus]MXQ50180.1 hypothetical protein [Salinicoccus hispanicus]